MFGFSKKTDKEIRQAIAEEKKEQKENQLKWYHYLISAMFVLFGLVLVAYVQIDIPFICKVLAVVFAIAGLISLVSYCIRDVAEGYYRLELVYGVTAGFAALLFYTKQEELGVYFPIIAGFILFANGVVKLQHSIDMKRIDRKMKKVTEMWLVVMIFALICIAAAFVTVYIKPAETRTMFLVIGISFIVAGLSDVFVHIVFNRKVRLFRSGEYEAGEVEESPAEIREDHEKEAFADMEVQDMAPLVSDTQDMAPLVSALQDPEPAPADEQVSLTEPEYESGVSEEETSDTNDLNAVLPDDNKPLTGEVEFPSWKATDPFGG